MHLTPKRAEISASVVLSNYMKYNTFQKQPKIEYFEYHYLYFCYLQLLV